MNSWKLILPFALIFSTAAIAADFGNWIVAEGYQPIERHQIALKSAQEWTAKEYGLDKYNYVYQITENEAGFYVSVVMAAELGSNLQSFPGGHFALYIDKKGKVYDVFRGA